ncbi:MAG: hypothetical protein ACE5HI_06335 [bacterium]
MEIEIVQIATAYQGEENGGGDVLYGLDKSGCVWWYRDHDNYNTWNSKDPNRKLTHPKGWYPLTMKKFKSFNDYKAAGVEL